MGLILLLVVLILLFGGGGSVRALRTMIVEVMYDLF